MGTTAKPSDQGDAAQRKQNKEGESDRWAKWLRQPKAHENNNDCCQLKLANSTTLSLPKLHLLQLFSLPHLGVDINRGGLRIFGNTFDAVLFVLHGNDIDIDLNGNGSQPFDDFL